MKRKTQEVREYPDIPARVVGRAGQMAADTIWEAVVDWARGLNVRTPAVRTSKNVDQTGLATLQPGEN